MLARISELTKIGTTIFIVAIDQVAEPNSWGSSQLVLLAKIAGALKAIPPNPVCTSRHRQAASVSPFRSAIVGTLLQLEAIKNLLTVSVDTIQQNGVLFIFVALLR
ncbi:hypothetical protein PCC6311_2317 [Synechococcus elongatus PCC 6311]|uniref:Uncharacterized protein n=2 Tax=Synechococcus elongatus TaxID=32046 RepID=Q31L06_SYNE7|nr:hypothetical protein Synpcc7942_2233 [Synechococcus elongatus PCC 7942 = FACHB-805]AJD58873.1 hypothetical protein M744_05175 [Synechococcus elongatus UTEX 2973]UOW72060.1 hypothetical protein PCC7943_2319 [Synechococcus elongatus PCC 7943]UOW74779.1 hypothetical protein PCC6311_2317 [Synechococcus elongatus PCC 6311]UOW77500.1 hypothetical protein PCC6301pg_2319 [Synechococcus elongatus PCC 6301]